jgi:capsid portal protein
MARQITEEQVFDPERNSLEWIINNKLLSPHQLKFIQVTFNKPEIGDSQDLANMIKTLGELGAFAPNDLREIAGTTIGKDLEPFDGDEFDKPMSAQKAPEGDVSTAGAKGQPKGGSKANQAIKKSHDTFVEVLKDVRDAIEELKENQGN